MTATPRRKNATAAAASPRPGSAVAGAPGLVPGCVVVFLLCLAVFANNLHHGFVFDDGGLIERNERIHSLERIGSLFTTPYWGRARNDGLYRPVTLLSYALSYRLSALSPGPYHAVNDVIHGLNAVLVALIAWVLFRSWLAGWCAGVLFAVLPAHTEAVDWIAGRAELIAAFFVLAAVLLAIFPRPLDRGSLRMPAVLIACLLGLLSKENAVVALPLVLAALLVVGEPAVRTARAAGRFLGRHAGLLAGWAAILVAWLALRAHAVAGGVRPTTFFDNPLVTASVGERVWTALSVFTLGLRRMVLPGGFSADYSPPKLPVLDSPWHPGVLLALAVLAVAGVAAIRLRHKLPAVSFWILFLLAAWLPASNLVIVIGTLFGERLLYLPSAAVCALAGFALSRLPRRWMTFAGLAVVTIVYGAATLDRNADWASNETLFAHEYRNRPCSARSLSNYAKVLEDSDPQRALAVYGEFLEVGSGFAAGQRSLGTFLLKRGRIDEAVAHLERANELEPGEPTTLLNLGTAYAEQRRWREAASCWEKLVRLDPDNRKARLNLDRVRRLMAAEGD